MDSLSPWRLAWRVFRTEGWRSFVNRSRDRLAALGRRRGYRLVDAGPAGAAWDVPVLNVLPTPPRPDLGGMQTQFAERLAREAGARPLAVLYPDGTGLRLEVETAGVRRALVLGSDPPPALLSLADAAFDRRLEDAVARVGARGVHVEQAPGLPWEGLAGLPRRGLRLVVSVHDFGLFCPRPHLLEHPRLRFCHYSADPGRCASCLGHDWRVDAGFQARRRDAARELLQSADAVVYPSEFLRDKHQELMPGLDQGRLWVVPLGGIEVPAAAPGRLREVRRVAYVGSVKVHKGAHLFAELVRRFPPERFPGLSWSVFGGGDPEVLRRLRRLPRTRVHGYYRAGTLPHLLRRHRVDLALLLSIVPESYGLTLDECRRADVPVVAFDHGAVAERVRRLGGGVLVPSETLESDDASAVDALAETLRAALGHGLDLPAPAPRAASAATCLEVYRHLGLLDGVTRDTPTT